MVALIVDAERLKFGQQPRLGEWFFTILSRLNNIYINSGVIGRHCGG